MQKSFFSTAAILVICLLVVYTLVIAYNNFPKNNVIFDGHEYFAEYDWDIWINGIKKEKIGKLPVTIKLKQYDMITMTALLQKSDIKEAVLWFKTSDTSVSVELDGVEAYTWGIPPEMSEKYLWKMWHFIELPDDYAGKTITITCQKLINIPEYIPLAVHGGYVSEKATVLTGYFVKNFGITFLVAVVCLFFSLIMAFFAVVLMTRDRTAVKILYFFLIFVFISLLAVGNNDLTVIYVQNSYFLYCLSYIAESLLLIPIMLYIGECYKRKYADLFSFIVKFDLIKTIILIVCEVFAIRTFAENILIINAVCAVESIVAVVIMVIELIHKNKDNFFIAIGSIFLAFMGLYEIFRLHILHLPEPTNNLYYGAAAVLISGSIQILSYYFKEVQEIGYIRKRNKEFIHLLDIQKQQHRKILDQIRITREVVHDFHHYRALIYSAVQSGNTQKLEDFLYHSDDIYKNMQMKIYCDISEINTIVSLTADKCQKNNIDFSAKIQLPHLSISVYDLCIVIGNILDNAVAGAQGNDEMPFVRLYIAVNENDLIICTENSYSGNLVKHPDGRFATTKRDKEKHGIGISTVEAIIKKYNGDLLFDYTDFVFKTIILFPAPQVL